MRKLIAWLFMYSLDGFVADEGTEYWQFCFGLPVDAPNLMQKIDSWDISRSYRLDLVSSTELSNGTVGLQYRRYREPSGPPVRKVAQPH